MNVKNAATLREVIALVLALILWFFVRTTRSGLASETLAQMQMTVPVQVKGMSEKLTPYDRSHDTARVTIQGDTEAISSLREQQISAFVDLSGEEASSVWPKVQVIVPGIVKLISVEPETINVKQAATVTKQAPVKVIVSGEAARGRTPGKPAVEPTHVTLSGPEPLINEITEVRTRVMLTGQSQSSVFELRDLVAVNADGQPVEARHARIDANPNAIWVTVPIEADSRSVAVAVSLDKVRVQKMPGWRTTLQVTPEFVTLRVSKGQQAPEFVSTLPEVFPSSSRVESRDVALDIPDGFEVIGTRTVRVRSTPIAERAETPVPTATPTPR